MIINLSIGEIAKAVKGEIINGSDNNLTIKNIAVDSRKVLPDSLFIALKGEKADGHDFILKAVDSGALGVIAQKNHVKQIDLQTINAPVIAVEDTLAALLNTAKYYKSLFKKLNITAGITGSVGKTTTKEFVYSVLSERFKTQKSSENHNTDTGMSFTLFELEEDTEAIILEMGMSGFGEIKRLSETANPDAAVITTIGTSHISNLGSREGIKKAKFEILDGMDYNANIILNGDEPLLYSEKNKTGRKEYFFGINNKDADFTAGNIEFDYDNGYSFFTVNNDNFKFKIPASGTHNIYNALPAFITGKIYGLSNDEIQAGFNNFQNVKMRQNIYDFNGITIIDDCYNASLESVKAALETLSKIKKINNNKKIAVLSDVLESGDFAEEIHRKIGESVVENKTDKVFAYGENSEITCRTIKKHNAECVYFDDKSEIAKALYKEAKKDDVILFKASRGMALETVIEDFKKLF